MRFFVSAARGLSGLVEQELNALGGRQVEVRAGGAYAEGPLALGYRCCLWSRVASRVLLVLDRGATPDADALYDLAARVDWSLHLDPSGTLAVTAAGTHAALTNTDFAALRVKDAIVDRIRAHRGQRPSVDRRRPDVTVHLHLEGEEAQLAIDLSGGGLHRRGYRLPRQRAPLRENLAAGLLLLADWPARAAEGQPLVDPMCGSGTLPIEAALMAADAAPGLLRKRHGFERWPGHEPATWQEVCAQARERDRRAQDPTVVLAGRDVDARALRAAGESARRAGVDRWVEFERVDIGRCAPPAGGPGLVVVNPPYGERLGERAALERLYLSLGEALKQRFGGYTAWVLSAGGELSAGLGLKATARHTLFNGPIECRWLRYPLTAATPRPKGAAPLPATRRLRRLLRDADAESFANRLRKNARCLDRWARRAGVTCYRVYDADLPQFAAAIDRYQDRVLVQEYAAPPGIDAGRAAGRLHDMLLLAAEVLEVEPQAVYLRQRRRQRGGAQYGKLEDSREFFEVQEGGLRFLVNLRDYLDTGLFLDQRLTRRLVGELSAGRAMLNLFCYTATATVYAARGGASRTCSVDLSPTYLEWARRNLAANGLREGGRHRLERADCLRWIEAHRGRYGVILLDPPTFSNSKRMRDTLDIQRDHAALLRKTARLLEPDGVLIFSTNRRGFTLDRAALPGLAVRDLGRTLLPRDFARRPQVHRVYRVVRAGAARDPGG